jgi:hypothetical protein
MYSPGGGWPTFRLGLDAVATSSPGASISVRTYGFGNKQIQFNPYFRFTAGKQFGIFGGAELRLGITSWLSTSVFLEGEKNDQRSEVEGRQGGRGGFEAIVSW